jgi:hypothetical protein
MAGAPYPQNPEGFQHIAPELLQHLEPDEREFLRNNKRLQQSVQDRELYGIFTELKKYGLDPGGERAQKRLAEIVGRGTNVGAKERLHPALHAPIARTAERIEGRMKGSEAEINRQAGAALGKPRRKNRQAAKPAQF